MIGGQPGAWKWPGYEHGHLALGPLPNVSLGFKRALRNRISMMASYFPAGEQ